VCARHSRAYIRHLFNVGEPSAGRLVTLHNLAWLSQLVHRARQAVLDGTFARLAGEVAEVWGARVAPGRQAEQLG
jgi:queuine tRNA-ribosyltransferase